ncbi:MAG: hypothetical protein HRU20_25235 [Pseudomonadales bacterium]|nr:hypothetical protein [Pseudomonadales bacterium]
MHKFTPLLLVGLILGGCQTTQEFRAASQKGLANSFSCSQISSAFSAYDADKQSLSALTDLANMTHMVTSNINTQNAAAYYDKAKQSANLALILQGCSPLT